MNIPYSPAADRNSQPILEVLQQILPVRGRATRPALANEGVQINSAGMLVLKLKTA